MTPQPSPPNPSLPSRGSWLAQMEHESSSYNRNRLTRLLDDVASFRKTESERVLREGERLKASASPWRGDVLQCWHCWRAHRGGGALHRFPSLQPFRVQHLSAPPPQLLWKPSFIRPWPGSTAHSAS